ncbi:hypothetical protein [Nitrococcus mobilis]|uniref:hypothetical protein n=1 Tax=Nitrococcus mobilis TaxID=35797 RepID=UPI0012E9F2F7|nr:hypothetical protein [Nitrococcus mobilis]
MTARIDLAGSEAIIDAVAADAKQAGGGGGQLSGCATAPHVRVMPQRCGSTIG